MNKRMAKNKSRQMNKKSTNANSIVSRVKSVWAMTRKTGLLFVAIALVTSLVYVGFSALDRPLDKVQLNARFERVNTLDVEKVLADYKQEKFLSINLEHLQESLENIDWVDRAEVRRVFPSALIVTLTEHVAAARWGDSGLLNTRGELILKNARYLPPELPRLDGPEGSEWQVAQQYLELRKAVLGFGLNVDFLGKDARGAWRFVLSNGTQVRIGRDSTDQRFYRFAHRVLPLMIKLTQTASVIDMRYSNGFAVKWQADNQVTSKVTKNFRNSLITKLAGEITHV